MDKIEKIRQDEAETSYDTQQYTPRPSVDIGDIARVQFAAHAKVFDKKRKAVFDWEQFKEVAGIFYGFGKKDSPATIKEVSDSVDLENEVDAYIENERYFPDDERPLVLEIARHFAEWGADHLRDSTKMVDKSLEEAAEKYLDGVFGKGKHQDFYVQLFKAGTKWQKEQDDKELSDLLTIAHLQGAEQMKKQMLKDIKLAYGKVSMNPFDCSEAFEELLNKVWYETKRH